MEHFLNLFTFETRAWKGTALPCRGEGRSSTLTGVFGCLGLFYGATVKLGMSTVVLLMSEKIPIEELPGSSLLNLERTPFSK